MNGEQARLRTLVSDSRLQFSATRLAGLALAGVQRFSSSSSSIPAPPAALIELNLPPMRLCIQRPLTPRPKPVAMAGEPVIGVFDRGADDDDPTGGTLALLCPGNPLALLNPGSDVGPGAMIASLAQRSKTIIVWSGTLAEGLFDREPRNWLPPGRRRFNEWLDLAVDAAARDGATILIRPHARHVISDVQSAMNLLREGAEAPLGLAFDPVALLEPGMLEHANDHLERSFESLGPVARMLLLTDAVGEDGSGNLHPVPIGDGALDWGHVVRLISGFVRESTPIVPAGGMNRDGVLTAEEFDRARKAMARHGLK